MNCLIRAKNFNKVSILFNKALKQQLDQHKNISTTKYLLAGFIKDYKPGPYPKTEAERLAAAKKYGLSPEEYKPYPDDGLGYGDYPDLGNVSTDMKSDWTDWDDPIRKRNYGEPFHVYSEMYTNEKGTLKETPYSLPHMLGTLGLICLVYFGLQFYFLDKLAVVPVAPKQYPRDVEKFGEKHYKI